MGQLIEVESTQVGNIAVFDTDRSITGQDGTAYGALADAQAGEDFPDQLAARLFTSDSAIDHVFVASNQVVVRRNGGWQPDVMGAAAKVIREFFVFYPEAV